MPLLLIFAVALSGCKSTSHVRLYEGPARSADQIAVIKVPHYIHLSKVDNVPLKASGRLLSGSFATYSLLPGEHRLGLRYHEFWPHEFQEDETVTVQSDEFILSVSLEPGKTYNVDLTRPESLRDAETFAEKPDFQYAVLSKTASDMVSDGGRYGLKTPKEIKPEPAAVEAVSSTPGSVPQKAQATPVQKPEPPAKTLQSSEPSSDALESLKKSWHEASDEDRKAFRKWIVDH